MITANNACCVLALLSALSAARKIQYFIPYGLRWLTSPIFSMLFDKKLLNLDTEHFKDVRHCL